MNLKAWNQSKMFLFRRSRASRGRSAIAGQEGGQDGQEGTQLQEPSKKSLPACDDIDGDETMNRATKDDLKDEDFSLPMCSTSDKDEKKKEKVRKYILEISIILEKGEICVRINLLH